MAADTLSLDRVEVTRWLYRSVARSSVSVEAPVSAASSSSSLVTPAGVLSFSGSASSEVGWLGSVGMRRDYPQRIADTRGPQIR